MMIKKLMIMVVLASYSSMAFTMQQKAKSRGARVVMSRQQIQESMTQIQRYDRMGILAVVLATGSLATIVVAPQQCFEQTRVGVGAIGSLCGSCALMLVTVYKMCSLRNKLRKLRVQQ